MLTNGFYLSMWCSLAALWLPRRRSRRTVALLVALSAVALFGVSLEASRNLILFALAIPTVALYLLRLGGRRRARVGWTVAVVAVAAAVVGGAFAARLWQSETTGTEFLNSELKRQPVLVRPLVPVYVNGVFPLEAAHRLYGEFPAHQPYRLGAYSLKSLPDAAFPEGKRDYGNTVAQLMEVGVRGPGLSWTVASYQGRLWADLGWAGVMLGSVLLGLGFGRLYRWARARRGFLAVAIVGYVTYYSVYMVYDNLLSFTLIAAFDLGVLFVLERYARGEELVRTSLAALGVRRAA
jgi:hypothetical protein